LGSLEADLEAVLFAIRRVLRHRTIRRILADLHAQIGREPALAEAIRPMQQARRERAHALVERAVARGELEDSVDRETIADLVAAPLYWRLVVVGGRSNREHIRRLARMSAAAARVA
jgi:glutathione S-transferase